MWYEMHWGIVNSVGDGIKSSAIFYQRRMDVMFSSLPVCLSLCLFVCFVSKISQKVMNGFRRNLVDRFVCNKDELLEILEKIEIRI